MASTQQPKTWNHPFWQWISSSMSAKDLEEIANADCGMEHAEHLEALCCLVSGDPTGLVLGWNPREVLELERWTEPQGDRSDQLHRHRLRLFASTALLVSATKMENAGFIMSFDANLGIAADSMLVLDQDRWLTFDDFLGSLENNVLPEVEDELPFLPLTRCVIAGKSRPLFEQRLGQEINRAMAAATHVREVSTIAASARRSWDWVLRASGHGMRRHLWRRLLDELLSKTAEWAPHGPEHRALIELRDRR